MMKLIQKILSHGLLIAFLVAGVFLYLHRADIFPQWFDDETQPVAANDNTDKAAVVSDSAPTASQMAIEQAQTGAARAPEPAEREAPTTPPGVQQDTGHIASADIPVEPASPATPPAADTPSADAPVVDDTPRFRPLDDEQPVQAVANATNDPVAPDQMPGQGAVQAIAPAPEVPPEVNDAAPVAPAQQSPVAPASTTALASQLERARALYWARDMQGAGAAYRAIAESDPNDADVWGEIGNFHFGMQQREYALEAYVRAFSIMVENGDLDRARALLGVVHELDADKARALEPRLRKTGG